jgi:DNA-binding NarL/FixJ family response regulator
MMPGQDPLCRYLAVEVLSLLDAGTGATDAARERADAYLEQSRQERVLHGTGALMHALGVAALADGDLDRAEQWAASLYEQAESVAQDALKVLADHGWRPLVTDALDLLAEIALFRRQHERAVRLTAGARALRGALGLVAFSPDRGRTERLLAAAGPALGDEKLNQALDEGARLSLQEAVAHAQRGRGEHASATHGWASLSPVEGQVAELASQGLNNPDIARDLFMSRNTVKAHLSHVYAKLGVANRTELAAFAARRRYPPG